MCGGSVATVVHIDRAWLAKSRGTSIAANIRNIGRFNKTKFLKLFVSYSAGLCCTLHAYLMLQETFLMLQETL
jgi:hypothetical protein